MSSKKGKSYARDISGLRDALFDEIEDLRDGASSPHEAVAFCSLSEQVLNTFTAEIKAHAYRLAVEEKRVALAERKVRLLSAPLDSDCDEDTCHDEETEDDLQALCVPH